VKVPLWAVTLVLAAAQPGAALAGDWYVDVTNPNCPGSGSPNDPFCAIQDGIAAAANGDTVHVAPGTYVENIDFVGKAIAVVGTGGSAVTTIDGNQAGSVVTFQSGEAAGSVLDGFTITRGIGTDLGGWLVGGGIYCDGSSPTITDSAIVANGYWLSGTEWGGGIYCKDASPTITDSTIAGNLCDGIQPNGGGIYCENSFPMIERTAIVGNTAVGYWGSYLTGAGGGIFCLASSPTITHSTIGGNTAGYIGGGVWMVSSAPVITDSSITGNFAGFGGGILCWASSPALVRVTLSGNVVSWSPGGGGIYSTVSAPTITDSILWANRDWSGGSDEIWTDGQVKVGYSDVQGGWSGTGNIDMDPLFVDPSNDDFRLSPTSPCIDAGTPAAAPTGTDLGGGPRFLDGDLDRGMRVDMGAHEFAHVQLAVTGTPTPGGQLTFDTTGTAGLGFVRLLGVADGEVLLRPFGPLFLDLASPWMLIDSGVIPNQTIGTIPPGIVTPLTLVFQDVAIDAVSGAGNTSNPVSVIIQ